MSVVGGAAEGPARTIAMLSHLASRTAPTGAERSLALLAEGLAARGHRVAVAAPGPWVLAESLRRAGVALETIPVRACWLVQAGRPPFPLQLVRWLRYAAPDPGRGRLEAWLRRLGPAAAHVNCLPHLRGAAAARAAGVPVVWHVREILPPGPRRRFFARRLKRDADRVVAVSRAVARWLEAEGLADRVDVIPNGVDPPPELPARAIARAGLGLPPGAMLAVWLGQLVPHKGAVEAVRAVAAAREQGVAVELVLAGDGPPGEVVRLDRELEGRGWARRMPPQAEPWELLAAADLVIVTSLVPDPLPRVVMEAMAAGRAVVGFSGGGVQEMVENDVTGVLVPVGELAALAAALAAVGADSGLREALGAAARERALGELSLARHVARMEAVLAAAAAPSAPPGRGGERAR